MGNHSTQEAEGMRITIGFRPTWATYGVPVQPGQQKENLSQTNKHQKRTKSILCLMLPTLLVSHSSP